jgi:integrase
VLSIRGHLQNYILATKNTVPHTYAQPFHEGIGALRLDQITKKVIGEFRDRLRTAGVSVAMTRHILNSVRTMFEYAIDQDYLSVNPARKVRVLSHRAEDTEKRTAPPKWLVASLIGEARVEPDSIKSIRLVAQITLAATTGIRASEAVGLRWRHISFERREIRIETRIDARGDEDGYTKSRAGRRTIPLGADTVSILAEWKGVSEFPADDDFVFANTTGGYYNHDYLRRRQFYPLFDRLTKRYLANPAGIEGKPTRFTWHELRHFAISTWIAANVPIKTIMTWAGHSSIQMTMDRYGHMFKNDQDWSTMDKLSEELVTRPVLGIPSCNSTDGTQVAHGDT